VVELLRTRPKVKKRRLLAIEKRLASLDKRFDVFDKRLDEYVQLKVNYGHSVATCNRLVGENDHLRKANSEQRRIIEAMRRALHMNGIDVP
jgi:hypothetical protein